MTLLMNLGLFALSTIVMIISGSFFIKSILRIAAFLRLSEFVVSFIIIGFATSLPELFVGISSALAKQPQISLGNVIGSNIANLTIIIGIPILLARGIDIKSKTIKKDSMYMFLIALLPLILMIIGSKLSKFDGVILILTFFAYSAWLIKERQSFTKKVKNHVGRIEILVYSIFFMFSIFLLHYSAKYTVKYASLSAIDLSMPPIFIGLFIIALGTSLPELVVGFSAVMNKNPDIILGNVMGSVVANSTIVLGITALIFPITTSLFIFFTSISFMVLTTFLFMTFVESGNKLYWKEGVAMILIYVVFLVMELYISNIASAV